MRCRRHTIQDVFQLLIFALLSSFNKIELSERVMSTHLRLSTVPTSAARARPPPAVDTLDKIVADVIKKAHDTIHLLVHEDNEASFQQFIDTLFTEMMNSRGAPSSSNGGNVRVSSVEPRLRDLPGTLDGQFSRQEADVLLVRSEGAAEPQSIRTAEVQILELKSLRLRFFCGVDSGLASQRLMLGMIARYACDKNFDDLLALGYVLHPSALDKIRANGRPSAFPRGVLTLLEYCHEIYESQGKRYVEAAKRKFGPNTRVVFRVVFALANIAVIEMPSQEDVAKRSASLTPATLSERLSLQLRKSMHEISTLRFSLLRVLGTLAVAVGALLLLWRWWSVLWAAAAVS